MDLEFHYWITAIVARRAGFEPEETRVIAYSSQLVDDNDVRYTVVDRATKREYRNYISQTMDITKPKRELMRIYPLFHFVPGRPDAESARRRDGKMHILNVTPGNETATAMLRAAFADEGPSRMHRIGVATHAYVDTWAHQNFVGWYDDFNGMGRIQPNIGHADAVHHPDLVAHRWDDDRLVNVVVNNNLRFLEAAHEVFGRYCDFLEADGRYSAKARPGWEPLERELLAMMGPMSSQTGEKRRERRIEAYRRAVEWLAPYDELEWFDAAIETEIHGTRDSHNGILSGLPHLFKDEYFWREDVSLERTDWYLFQEAVRAHQAFGMALIAPVYDQMRVNIWEV